jgi:hypothetical protein
MNNITIPPIKSTNYYAKIVALPHTYPLEGLDNLVGAMIFGSQVLLSKDSKQGDIGLFFPLEVAISTEFCAANNLYRKHEYGNSNHEGSLGFFETHRRVRALKLRGHRSEGFWIPISSLNYLGINHAWEENLEFDTIIIDNIEHSICCKYQPKQNPTTLQRESRKRQPKPEDLIIPGQFAFHYDTQNLRRNPEAIHADDYISITDKWHGTSAVIGRLLVQSKQTLVGKCLAWLTGRSPSPSYSLVYSSRTVVKGVGDTEKQSEHYYSTNIWKVVAQEVADKIPSGYTVYGEIVGYLGNGSWIQKGYDYGCVVGQHKFVVYRVTITNIEGRVQELSWPQVQEFCKKQGLDIVPTLAYGIAKDIFFISPTWDSLEFIKLLEAVWVDGGDCSYNTRKVPAEGIVVRIDRGDTCEAYKLKNFRFLEHETKMLDENEVGVEDAENTSNV